MEQANQTLTLINRKELALSGVEKVISLKPDTIQLKTNLGGLVIFGSNLELKQLDNSTNQISIIGNISTLKYLENNFDKTNLLKKIFK